MLSVSMRLMRECISILPRGSVSLMSHLLQVRLSSIAVTGYEHFLYRVEQAIKPGTNCHVYWIKSLTNNANHPTFKINSM